MSSWPDTRFADTGAGRVAYQTVGDGPVDVLVCHPPNFPIDLMWEEPTVVDFLTRLSSFGRHTWYDPRGRGASDPVPAVEDFLDESIAEDARAVLDHLGWERAAVLSLGSAAGLHFAATHPERTTALVLVNTTARTLRGDDYPIGIPSEDAERILQAARHSWGSGASLSVVAPSLAGDVRLRRWFAKCERLTCTAEEIHRRTRVSWLADHRGLLPMIHVPTLVVQRRGLPTREHGRYLAEHIASASYIELEGVDRLFFAGDTGSMLDAIAMFLSSDLPTQDTDRVLSTVLFTDIVGSTELASRLGDKRWSDLVAAHDIVVRRELERFRGNEVKSTGDGFRAIFDGPARAVRCGVAIRDAVSVLGITVRAGLHTGEIDIRGSDLAGIGVHIAARVCALAQASEVLVSRTVVDLVVGSRIEFEDRGEHKLKGVPDNWRLFRVTTS